MNATQLSRGRDNLSITLVFVLLAALAVLPVAQVIAQQADYVIHISVDGLRPDAITTLGPVDAPNFYRMRTQGAFTDNARADYAITVTLPDHASQLTGRVVFGTKGHGWGGDEDPKPGQTLASNKSSYVAGVFDVVHDNGLRTGEYAGKTKFSLFATTWNATNGAPDAIGTDQGKNKIDRFVINTNDSAVLVATLATDMMARPMQYVFLHLTDPDTTGHSNGWGGLTPAAPYLNTIKDMDCRLGSIFAMIDHNTQLVGRTAIILTADHGGFGKDHADAAQLEDYAIPFYVWGPGVLPGADLYALNAGNRLDLGKGRTNYSAVVQPIRNGEAANVALKLLGLGPVPGSTINFGQDLALTLSPPNDFRLISVGTNCVVTFTLVPNARHTLQSCDELATGSWNDAMPDVIGPGGTLTNINVGPVPRSARFFRLRLHF